MAQKRKKHKGRCIEREREWQGEGRGACFYWPLECVSNIFRVCSGKSLSLCASAPSFCVRVAAGSQHPAALLRKRAPVTLPTPSYNLQTSAFQYCIRSGPKKEKKHNAGIKSLNLRGLERQRCFRAPKQSSAVQHRGQQKYPQGRGTQTFHV